MRSSHELAFVAIALAALAGFVPAQAAEVSVGVTVGSADYSGFLQTPTGGQPGTATIERPTFREMGTEGEGVVGAQIEVAVIDRFRLEAAYLRSGDDGRFEVADELIFNGATYPAGSEVAVDFGFDTLELAAFTEFAAGSDTRIDAGLIFVRSNFELQLVGTAPTTRLRTYHINALGLAAQVQHRIDDVDIGLDVVVAPAYGNFHAWYRLEPFVSRAFGDWRLRLAVVFDWVDYDDGHKQTLPNHLDFKRITPAAELRYTF